MVEGNRLIQGGLVAVLEPLIQAAMDKPRMYASWHDAADAVHGAASGLAPAEKLAVMGEMIQRMVADLQAAIPVKPTTIDATMALTALVMMVARGDIKPTARGTGN